MKLEELGQRTVVAAANCKTYDYQGPTLIACMTA